MAALYVTEILLMTFEYLDNPSDVFSCALVSKVWSNVAMPILWTGNRKISLYSNSDYERKWPKPHLQALVQLSKNKEKFRYYTSLMRHCTIKADRRRLRAGFTIPDAFWDCDAWSSAQYLSLFVEWDRTQPLAGGLQAMIRPSLRILNLKWVQISHSLLDAIKV